MLFALGAMLVICVAMSTKDQRAAARRKLRKYEPIANAITAAILFIFVVGAIWKGN